MADDFIDSGLGLVAAGKFEAPPPAPAASPSYPLVAPHPAPDNSGAMINMSDADWVKFQAGQAPAAPAPKATTAIDVASPPATSPAPAKAATDTAPPAEPDFDVESALGQVTKGTFKPTTPPPPRATGFMHQVGYGSQEGVYSLANVPTQMPRMLGDAATGLYNWVTGKDVQNPTPSFAPPQPLPEPINAGERFGRAIGQALPTLPLMAAAPAAGLLPMEIGGAAAGSVGRAALNASHAALMATPPVIAGQIGGQAAAEAVPEDWQDTARTGAQLLTGGVAGLAERGLRPVATFAAQQSGMTRPTWLGGPPVENMGGVAARAPQINVVANQLDTALGPKGTQLLKDKIATEREARNLEAFVESLDSPLRSEMVNTTISPWSSLQDRILQATVQAQDEAVAKAKLRLNEINAAGAGPGGRLRLVPGSNPTTAQVAPTPEMLRLDKATKVAGGEGHETQATANNTAQINAIKGLQPEGNPGDVGQLLTQRLAEIEQAGEANVAAAKSNINQQVQGLNIRGTPDSRGEAVRSALDASKQTEKANQDRIFNAIDPHNDLALDVSPQMEAAKAVRSQFDVRDWGTVDPVLRTWTERLERSNGVEFFSRFRQNLSDLSADIRTLRGQGIDPASNTLRLLNQLKNGMQQSLVEAGQRQGEADQAAVTAGTLPPEETLYARMKAERDAWLGQQPEQPAAPPEANWDQAATDRYNTARAGYSDYKQTYGTGAVGRTLQPGANGEDFRVENAKVPNQFLTGNQTEPARVQKFTDAVHGSPAAMGELRNAFVSELQDKGIIRDGEVNGAKLAEWQRVRQGTIDKFAGLGDQISDLARVQTLVDEARAAQAAATKEAQAGALGYFIRDDPMTAVKKALSKDNPTENMRQLIQTIRGSTADPAVKAAAEAGLRRAAVEYLVQEAQSSQPAGTTGYNYLKKATTQDLIADNKEALKVLFGGQGYQTLNMVAADIRRAQQAPLGTGGSDTTANNIQAQATASTSAFLNPTKTPAAPSGGRLTGKELVEAGVHSVARSALAILGVTLGEMIGEGAGLVGAFALPGIIDVVKVMRQSGIRTQTQLRTAAMLDPELALRLHERVQANKDLTSMQRRRLKAAIRAAVLAPQISGQRIDQKQIP